MIRLQGDYADADREERYARQSRAEQTGATFEAFKKQRACVTERSERASEQETTRMTNKRSPNIFHHRLTTLSAI